MTHNEIFFNVKEVKKNILYNYEDSTKDVVMTRKLTTVTCLKYETHSMHQVIILVMGCLRNIYMCMNYKDVANLLKA